MQAHGLANNKHIPLLSSCIVVVELAVVITSTVFAIEIRQRLDVCHLCRARGEVLPGVKHNWPVCERIQVPGLSLVL